MADRVLAMRADGMGVCEIGRRLGLHRKAVARVIARNSA
jgi:ActR/RegA family two-component response regulator